MTEFISLQTGDGHILEAYVAQPEAKPKAGLLVLQEIFGVNPHMRSVTEHWGELGFLALAPALFDRVRPGVELDYTPETLQEGQQIRAEIPREKTIEDLRSAVQWLRDQGVAKVFAVGYCWGGSMAWAANTHLSIDGSSSYYGGMIRTEEQNHAPAIFHFGAEDKHIGPEQWEKIRTTHPDLPVYVYDGADHAFNRAGYPPYNEAAAKLAEQRTLDFFNSLLA